MYHSILYIYSNKARPPKYYSNNPQNVNLIRLPLVTEKQIKESKKKKISKSKKQKKFKNNLKKQKKETT